MSQGEVISKSRADRLGEELRHGQITADLIERLSAYREQLVLGAKGASEAIRELTPNAVTPREGKSTGSIVAKLRRQPIALSRMQDIVGCRIIVNTVVEQDDLARRIAIRFPDARLIDRRIKPSYVLAMSKVIDEIEQGERQMADDPTAVDEAMKERLSRLRNGVLETLDLVHRGEQS